MGEEGKELDTRGTGSKQIRLGIVTLKKKFSRSTFLFGLTVYIYNNIFILYIQLLYSLHINIFQCENNEQVHFLFFCTGVADTGT